MINSLIFDLDGTLVNTVDDITTAINNMLVKLGYDTRTKGEVLSFLNRGARHLVKSSLPESVSDSDFIVDSALSIYEECYSECYCEKSEPFENMLETIEQLKEMKIKLGVISNKQDKFVKDIVEKLFGKKTFNFIMGQSHLPTKPNPESTLYVCKMLGSKPQKCLFVGDSDVDMLTAKNAGMRGIGVSWGYRASETIKESGADFMVESPEEIIIVVKRLHEEYNAEKQKRKQK